jgi:putative modified peptide
MAKLPDQERDQISALLQRVVTDGEFRQLFEADPANAIESSGIGFSSTAVTRIVEGMDLLPAVTAHASMAGQASIIIIIING